MLFLPSLTIKFLEIRTEQYISKKLSSKFIDNKIIECSQNLKEKITQKYIDFRYNFIQTCIINLLIIVLSILALIFSSTNFFCIILISIITIYALLNSILKSLKRIKLLKKEWHKIYPRIKSFFHYKKNFTLKETVNNMIEDEFNFFYYSLNSGIKFIHWIGSKTGFLQTKNEIRNNIIQTFSSLILNYVFKIILSKIITILIFYSIFIFLLKPYILQISINMNFFSILIYPFTYLIPFIIHHI